MTVKESVRQILEQNRGKTVSGQELAERLQVSRAAIWKAVKSLQSEGHTIEASTNKGYRLDPHSDVLSAEGIRAYLSAALRECPLTVYRVIDSTNSQAKRLALEGASHGTVLVAEEQSAGRGRRGKSFFSPSGTGIYMSVILRPGTAMQAPQRITIHAAVAVSRAIERCTGLRPLIKWVNDLYLNGRKICGILTEAVSDFESGSIESLVVGIGINVSTKAEMFPAELAEIAGSLTAAVSRNQLIACVLEELFAGETALQAPELIEEYKARSMMQGLTIAYTNAQGETTGRVRDINEQGNLVVEKPDGSVEILQAGEVRITGGLPVSGEKGRRL